MKKIALRSLRISRDEMSPKLILWTLLVLVIFSLSWWVITDQYKSNLLEEKRHEVEQRLVQKGNQLNGVITSRLMIIYAISAYTLDQIERERDFSSFETFAQGITSSKEGVVNINIAPRGITQFVYPYEINSSLIGKSLINDDRPNIRADIQQAIMTGNPVASGPYILRQGMKGIAIRDAIFYEDRLWGLVSITFDMNSIIRDSNLTTVSGEIEFALQNSRGTILGSEQVFSGDPLQYIVEMPGNNLELVAAPVGGWDNAIKDRYRSFQILSLAVFLLLFLLIRIIIYRNEVIHKKIKIMTQELKGTNEQLFRELESKKRTEERLKNAQTMAMVGNWELEMKTSKFWASEEVYHIYGFNQHYHPMTFEAFQSNVKRTDKDQKDMAMKKLMTTGERYDVQYHIRKADDQEERILHSSAELIKDSEGNPLKIIGVVQDITNRAMAESALRESERSKSALLANLPGMSYRCKFDPEWTMEFVSEGCFEITGYDVEDFIMNQTLSFNDTISPTYREYLWDRWVEVLWKKEIFTEEYTIITATGEEKWVWEQGRGVYDDMGSVVAIEGLILDVTEQREKEEAIVYLNYHDTMTGIYNRRYFDEAKLNLDKKEFFPLSVVIADVNGLKLINDGLGHEEGDKLLIGVSRILESVCREGDVLARTGGDEFYILLPNTSENEVADLVHRIEDTFEKHKEDKTFETILTGVAIGYGTKNLEEQSFPEIMKDAERFMYRRKLLQSKSLHSSIVNSMKTTLFEKSFETEKHAERIAALSRVLGTKLGLGESEITELELLSTLHDIGKIVTRDSILNKAGKLTIDEYEEMKRHSEIGFRIAQSSPELKPIAFYILCHHERWDGKGYPNGIAGNDIPLLSRIISVVDAYDAMTEDRAYRKAMGTEAALEELEENKGTQFDPTITEEFVKLMRNGEAGNFS